MDDNKKKIISEMPKQNGRNAKTKRAEYLKEKGFTEDDIAEYESSRDFNYKPKTEANPPVNTEPTKTEPKVEPKPEPKLEAKQTEKGITDHDYDPFAQDTIKREYTQINADASNIAESLKNEIPEPTFEQPTLVITQEVEPEPEKTEEEKKKEVSLENIQNPSLIDADDKQKRIAAKNLADMAISAYETLHTLGQTAFVLTDIKIKKKFKKLNIDIAVLEYRFNNGYEEVSVRDFLNSYNAGVKNTLVVSEEFKNKVRPLLIEIFKARGWGLTPEQTLIGYVIQDGAEKIAALYSISNAFTENVKILSEIHKEQKMERERKAAETVVENPTKRKKTDVQDVPYETVREQGEEL